MKIYGVIHLKGLPGSTSNDLSISEITTLAQNDINALTEGGVDGIIIENFGDAPFVKDNLSKRSLVSFTTVASNLELDKNIDLRLKNVNLYDVTPDIDSVKIGGKVNGLINLRTISNKTLPFAVA